MCEREREELEQPVGNEGSQFWTYRGALKKFLKVEVHNWNEVNDSSIFFIYLNFCMEPFYHLTSFRETCLTEA